MGSKNIARQLLCSFNGNNLQGRIMLIQQVVDNGVVEKKKISLGDIPIMVQSKHCHLANLTPTQVVAANEDCTEVGGYFILNGLEKLLRQLQVPKKNYAFGITRGTFHMRKKNFTNYAVSMKCVREDLYAKTIYLHYSYDGNIYVNVMIKKAEYLIPAVIVLKALEEISDRQLYNILVRGFEDDSFVSERVEVLLNESHKRSVYSKQQCLSYLGLLLKGIIQANNPNYTHAQVGEIFLKEYIMVHCDTNQEKINVLAGMIQKLYSLVSGKVEPDNLDALVNHDILLPGHFYMMFFREKLEEVFQGIKSKVYKDVTSGKEVAKIREINYIERAIDSMASIGKKIEYLIATGNLKSQTGLDLMQMNGYSFIAEKLNNMRFVSHLRSIHRGAYFTEMKTTTVRKLLPENWGFLCPVHTPDGGLCGLLNHLSYGCRIQCAPFKDYNKSALVDLCVELGMFSTGGNLATIFPTSVIEVVHNSIVLGYITQEKAAEFCAGLRKIKVLQTHPTALSPFTSIAYIPPSSFNKSLQYRGIYLYSTEGRPLRQVLNLQLNQKEWIDPLEQSYMSIACTIEDIRKDTTHQELHPDLVLSELASQIPFLEHNQSPRNMYQCQMAKQTMGTSYHNHPYRVDNKIYKITNPQLPLVRCDKFEDIGFNEYPSGTNAVVAVISYTGYDIEDAMIINKSSYERGFGHGCVYKTHTIQVNPEGSTEKQKRSSRFRMLYSEQQNLKAQKLKVEDIVEKDGIAPIGTQLGKGKVEMITYDTNKNELKKNYFKDTEKAYLEQVTLVAREGNSSSVDVSLKCRYVRNPIIGDKFSSRHGQKGVLSVLWPQIDMPFSESGITPDIIINPNAFPSRMTIGMLIESMVGKVSAMDGRIARVRAFENYKNDNVVDYFGKELKNHGFNYFGNEVLYSGIFGTPFKVDIFIGVVYYQRLRHMVSDKFQARSTGPSDALTRQPVKGRKRGGGIRLGEMERDALIAHGVSYCLHDRLMNCSDYSEGYVCEKCGSLLSAYATIATPEQRTADISHLKEKAKCTMHPESKCSKVAVPYVLRYLTNELAAMNIKLSFTLC
jgi:DNA-directed RNA polymerase I subunit RPA2